jgi:hypothetical protein
MTGIYNRLIFGVQGVFTVGKSHERFVKNGKLASGWHSVQGTVANKRLDFLLYRHRWVCTKLVFRLYGKHQLTFSGFHHLVK